MLASVIAIAARDVYVHWPYREGNFMMLPISLRKNDAKINKGERLVCFQNMCV